MWCHRVLAYALFTVILASRASADTPVFLGFVDTSTRLAVQRSVEGAATRLARPDCQDVFADFTDAAGQRLSTTLVARGEVQPRPSVSCDSSMTARRRNAARAPPRRSPRSALRSFAFAACSSEIGLQNRTTTEIIVIHEFLHAPGLGENPPTSEAITKQVAVRCGGRD